MIDLTLQDGFIREKFGISIKAVAACVLLIALSFFAGQNFNSVDHETIAQAETTVANAIQEKTKTNDLYLQQVAANERILARVAELEEDVVERNVIIQEQQQALKEAQNLIAQIQGQKTVLENKVADYENTVIQLQAKIQSLEKTSDFFESQAKSQLNFFN